MSCETGSRDAATVRRGDWDCPRLGMVLPAPRGGGGGRLGTMYVADGTGTRSGTACDGPEGRCRGALRALVRDDDRGGTLPGGML